MTTDEIRDLIHLVIETGIAELEVQRGENRVRIRRSTVDSGVVVQAAPVPVAVAAPVSLPATGASTPPPAAEVPAPKAASRQEAAPAPDLTYVKSPIVGTFYESPSPDSPPFVRVGDRVTPGKVVCIIESMKLMNEIEADVAGVIESRLVENGQPVEYGEALFGIRPV